MSVLLSVRDNDELVGELSKSLLKFIRVSVGDHETRPYIYVEIFDKDAPDQIRAGLTMRPQVAEGLMGLLTKALGVANSRRAGRKVIT